MKRLAPTSDDRVFSSPKHTRREAAAAVSILAPPAPPHKTIEEPKQTTEPSTEGTKHSKGPSTISEFIERKEKMEKVNTLTQCFARAEAKLATKDRSKKTDNRRMVEMRKPNGQCKMVECNPTEKHGLHNRRFG